MNILITGNAGSGKSAICDLLRKRGYYALSADFNDCAESRDAKTLRAATYERGDGYDKLNGLVLHWKKAALVPLLEAGLHTPELRFFDGYADNMEDFYQYFDKMFVVVIGPELTKERLLTRTSGSWGKHPDEMRHALEHIKPYAAKLTAAGAITIDGSQPLDKVVNDILKLVAKPVRNDR